MNFTSKFMRLEERLHSFIRSSGVIVHIYAMTGGRLNENFKSRSVWKEHRRSSRDRGQLCVGDSAAISTAENCIFVYREGMSVSVLLADSR
jgi:hypothetical protein